MRSEYGSISACIVWFFLYLAILRETRKKEVYTMVKGVSRRVIVVKSPDPRLFEEAIFIVKEEAFCGRGVSAEQVLQEARSVAKGYVKRNTPFMRWLRRIAIPAYLAMGALMATACWSFALYLC